MTEFESFALSKYLVGTWLVGFEKKKVQRIHNVSK